MSKSPKQLLSLVERAEKKHYCNQFKGVLFQVCVCNSNYIVAVHKHLYYEKCNDCRIIIFLCTCLFGIMKRFLPSEVVDIKNVNLRSVMFHWAKEEGCNCILSIQTMLTIVDCCLASSCKYFLHIEDAVDISVSVQIKLTTVL